MTQVCIGLESNFVTSNISAHFHKLQVGNILNPDWVQVILLINFAKLAVGIFVRQMINIRLWALCPVLHSAFGLCAPVVGQ